MRNSFVPPSYSLTSTVWPPTSNRGFNRQSVQSAIKSAQQRLKLYNNKCPTNGLAVFCGLAEVEDRHKERMVTVDLEPPRPIKFFLYRCDSRFHTEQLKSLCVEEGEQSYGFIVVDGNGALFGLLQGSRKEVLHKFLVDLPSKTRRGGQSALRFERIRAEKRYIYIRKVAELATTSFLSPDTNRPNVAGLVIAGKADCKDDLLQSGYFRRLRPHVVKSLDVSYGGESGFDQAIDQSAETIGSVKLVREKRLLERYFEEIDRGTGKYCFSIQDTLLALDMGAVEDLIVWDALDVNRYVMQNRETGEEIISFLSKEQEETKNSNRTNSTFDVIRKDSLVDWICDNHQDFGCNLELVSDRSGVGRQFADGFGGIGGMLRWSVDFASLNSHDEESARVQDEKNDEDDYDFADGDFAL